MSVTHLSHIKNSSKNYKKGRKSKNWCILKYYAKTGV